MVPHLKPCPLCGCNTARIGYIRDGASISCVGCGMSTHAFHPDAHQKAAEKWNRRAEAAPPAPSVVVKALSDAAHDAAIALNAVLEKPEDKDRQRHARYYLDALRSALSEQVQDARSADDEETYQIGIRDGYSQAVQEIDRLTGGDGEYRYCTDHDPERHTPGPAEMIQRIVDRFETLNLIGDAEKRGDFWDAPGSAQVQDVAERKPLGLNITKEWFEKRAALESDHEIGVGRRKLTASIDPTPEELAELHRLAHRIPEGWQLVPIEPTQEMCEAAPSLPAIDAINDLPLKKSGWSMSAIVNRKRYLAMLAAASAKREG